MQILLVFTSTHRKKKNDPTGKTEPKRRKKNKTPTKPKKKHSKIFCCFIRHFMNRMHNIHGPDYISIKLRGTKPVTLRSLFAILRFFSCIGCKLIITFCKSIFAFVLLRLNDVHVRPFILFENLYTRSR